MERNERTPIYRNNHVIFEQREKDAELIVSLFKKDKDMRDDFVQIIHGWTVNFTLSEIQDYIATFRRDPTANPNRGFFLQWGENKGYVALSHKGCCVMRMTVQEMRTIVDFIEKFFARA